MTFDRRAQNVLLNLGLILSDNIQISNMKLLESQRLRVKKNRKSGNNAQRHFVSIRNLFSVAPDFYSRVQIADRQRRFERLCNS
jgi:hypothetical protein